MNKVLFFNYIENKVYSKHFLRTAYCLYSNTFRNSLLWIPDFKDKHDRETGCLFKNLTVHCVDSEIWRKKNVQEKWIDLSGVRIYFAFRVKNMSLDYSQQKTLTFISKNKHRF